MSDNPGVQIVGARSKRTHREMADDSDDNEDPDWFRSTYPSRAGGSSVHLPPPPTPPTPRYGYDYRRPMMLSPAHNAINQNVIDLTEEPESPPRHLQTVPRIRSGFQFPGDIMNSDASNQTPVIDLDAEGNDPIEVSSSSADVQFVGASTIRPSPMEPRHWDSNGFAMYYPPPQRPRTRPRDSGHGRRSMPGNPASRSNDSLFSFLSSGVPADMLPYSVPAFTYNSSAQPVQRPRRNSYKSPLPAAEGFTRCLKDENVPVCPHCEEELGTGEGRKQEIYISKPCGHVYCGECAENRSISKSKKASPKTKPFSKCQVAGCNKPVSSQTAMTHLFL